MQKLCVFYAARGPLQTARELGEQLLSLIHDQEAPARLISSLSANGVVLRRLGELNQAREYSERALTLYEQHQQHSTDAVDLAEAVVLSRVILPAVLWELGYPDQALRKSEESLAFKPQLLSPIALTRAHQFAATLHHQLRQPHVVQERAEAVLTLATEHGFAQFIALGTITHGWALSLGEHPEEGIVQLRQGLSALQATGSEVIRSSYMIWLAEAYERIGQTAEGLRVLDESQALMNKTGARFSESALHLCKGRLLLQQAIPDEKQAEACFHQALDIARHQQAKSWELRAVTSLARLWQSQDKRQDATDLLAPVYEWFTEGFDTADLVEAKAFLDELTEEPS